MSEVEYASAEDLLAGDVINEEEITLPNGKKVVVKGLSAFERKLIYKNAVHNGEVDAALIETRIIKYGLVKPALTMEQAEKWMKVASISAVDAVTLKVRDLSGMGEGADKSKV